MTDLISTVAPAVRGMLGAGAPEVRLATDDFSPCGHFRYRLDYWWRSGVQPLLVVGQNPSKASHQRTDPTALRCARRAHRAGLGGLVMLNMFPRVATDPADLWAAGEDVAEEAKNMFTIRNALIENIDAPVLFAPGGDPHPRHRAQAAKVEAILRGKGVDLLCLGTTAAGLPRHPSRLGYDVPMVPWTGSFAVGGSAA
ncbi:DUF1643 domain-containing protein [Falsiroseomonas sp.]|uniref:DUF1643 domain-containing protein n=1 Tax=Falsiroseomonas sp. TaxID=2870721 RepID=UPI002732DBC1|nr:DUF1643 domain-containing protein [Falsiroseomonas sp.]MDP3417895.1 DUF1643 domain-containing protein [Falsiroseomonas sp.]